MAPDRSTGHRTALPDESTGPGHLRSPPRRYDERSSASGPGGTGQEVSPRDDPTTRDGIAAQPGDRRLRHGGRRVRRRQHRPLRAWLDGHLGGGRHQPVAARRRLCGELGRHPLAARPVPAAREVGMAHGGARPPACGPDHRHPDVRNPVRRQAAGRQPPLPRRVVRGAGCRGRGVPWPPAVPVAPGEGGRTKHPVRPGRRGRPQRPTSTRDASSATRTSACGSRGSSPIPGPDDPRPGAPASAGTPLSRAADPALGTLGRIHEIDGVLRSTVVDEVAICLAPEDGAFVEPIARLCEEQGLVVRIPLFEGISAVPGGRVEDFDGIRIQSLAYGPDRTLSLVAKRVIDIVGGAGRTGPVHARDHRGRDRDPPGRAGPDPVPAGPRGTPRPAVRAREAPDDGARRRGACVTISASGMRSTAPPSS